MRWVFLAHLFLCLISVSFSIYLGCFCYMMIVLLKLDNCIWGNEM